MFTTEKREKRVVAHIETSMFTTENEKNGYVVHIETSMFTTVKMAMLYIRDHKIPQLSVE